MRRALKNRLISALSACSTGQFSRFLSSVILSLWLSRLRSTLLVSFFFLGICGFSVLLCRSLLTLYACSVHSPGLFDHYHHILLCFCGLTGRYQPSRRTAPVPPGAQPSPLLWAAVKATYRRPARSLHLKSK